MSDKKAMSIWFCYLVKSYLLDPIFLFIIEEFNIFNMSLNVSLKKCSSLYNNVKMSIVFEVKRVQITVKSVPFLREKTYNFFGRKVVNVTQVRIKYIFPKNNNRVLRLLRYNLIIANFMDPFILQNEFFTSAFYLRI